jgi:hypothetical protein
MYVAKCEKNDLLVYLSVVCNNVKNNTFRELGESMDWFTVPRAGTTGMIL